MHSGCWCRLLKDQSTCLAILILLFPKYKGVHSQVFERLLSQKMPRLYRHLKENGIDPLLYITPWFMALYTSLPCGDSVLTIWHLLLLEGLITDSHLLSLPTLSA